MPSAPKHASAKRLRRLTAQAKALSAARARLGLSQPAAADALGVSVWTYRSWEQGLRQPEPPTRLKIAELWAVAPKALAAEEDGRCPNCGRPY